MPIAFQPPRVSSLISTAGDEAMNTLKFAGKLDVYRQMYDLTIEELADKCGVPYKTMERLVFKKNSPSARTLLLIMKGTGIKFQVDDLEEGI